MLFDTAQRVLVVPPVVRRLAAPRENALRRVAAWREATLRHAVMYDIPLEDRVGLLALRTAGVGFMIVTLMFAQAGYLTILYFTTYTRGDEGLVLQRAQRMLGSLDLSQPGPRYFAALGLFAVGWLAFDVLGDLSQNPFAAVLWAPVIVGAGAVGIYRYLAGGSTTKG